MLKKKGKHPPLKLKSEIFSTGAVETRTQPLCWAATAGQGRQPGGGSWSDQQPGGGELWQQPLSFMGHKQFIAIYNNLYQFITIL